MRICFGNLYKTAKVHETQEKMVSIHRKDYFSALIYFIS